MEHEYSILDHDRGRVFNYIGILITILAAGYAAGVGLVSQVMAHFAPHIWGFVPKAIDGGLAFGIIYAGFNKYFWKASICRAIFGYRDISGDWEVQGTTLGPLEALDDGKVRNWHATITISQQWTRISVRQQRPDNSASYSRSAALQRKGDETLLMYSYDNSPSMEARHKDGLQTHTGYCEIMFAVDGKTAQGSYFNNLGRFTHGTLKLTKIQKRK